MDTKSIIRIAGLLLLALGITSLVWGLDVSDTFADRFMKQMAGKYPKEERDYIFWGVTLIAIGAGVLWVSFSRKKN